MYFRSSFSLYEFMNTNLEQYKIVDIYGLNDSHQNISREVSFHLGEKNERIRYNPKLNGCITPCHSTIVKALPKF